MKIERDGFTFHQCTVKGCEEVFDTPAQLRAHYIKTHREGLKDSKKGLIGKIYKLTEKTVKFGKGRIQR